MRDPLEMTAAECLGLTKPAGAKKVSRACLGCGAALHGTEGTSEDERGRVLRDIDA